MTEQPGSQEITSEKNKIESRKVEGHTEFMHEGKLIQIKDTALKLDKHSPFNPEKNEFDYNNKQPGWLAGGAYVEHPSGEAFKKNPNYSYGGALIYCTDKEQRQKEHAYFEYHSDIIEAIEKSIEQAESEAEKE